VPLVALASLARDAGTARVEPRDRFGAVVRGDLIDVETAPGPSATVGVGFFAEGAVEGDVKVGSNPQDQPVASD